jgi:hypothetical protein
MNEARVINFVEAHHSSERRDDVPRIDATDAAEVVVVGPREWWWRFYVLPRQVFDDEVEDDDAA